MKLFQRFRRRELTPLEQLAEYESEIAYNQSVIENSENSIQILTNTIHNRNFGTSDLIDFFNRLDDYNITLENAKSNLKYYEVLRNNLKKELESQNS
mgnify:CR=1 FL=1